jgi:cytochrome P450
MYVAAATFSSKRIRVDDENSGMLAAGTRGPDGLDVGAPISLTTMEPPLHTAFRQVLMPLFSPRRVRPSEPGIRASAVALLKNIRRRGSCEVVREFAAELGPFSSDAPRLIEGLVSWHKVG